MRILVPAGPSVLFQAMRMTENDGGQCGYGVRICEPGADSLVVWEDPPHYPPTLSLASYLICSSCKKDLH